MTVPANIPQVVVLVPSEFVEVGGEPCWTLLFVNHDYAAAMERAGAWALEHPGKSPVVMVYANHGIVVPQMDWARK